MIGNGRASRAGGRVPADDATKSSVGGCDPPAGPRAIRVAIASDNRLAREGLTLLLMRSELHPVEVVDMAELAAPVRRLVRLAPDVLLIDAGEPAGIEMIHLAHRMLPEMKVIAFGLAEIEPRILACARAGMAGFVAPGASIEELVAAIRSAISGELVCSPRVAALLLGQIGAVARAEGAAVDAPAPLTRREREIALLMGEGLSNKQIARALGIKSATVKNHVHMILSKLRLKRRGEVAAQLLQGRLRGLHTLLGKASRLTV